MTGSRARSYRPVIVLADDASAGRLEASLSRRPEWAVPRPRLDLLAAFGRLLWGFETGDGSAGVSSLTSRSRFDLALRRLADLLVAPWLAAGTSNVLDACTDGARLAPFLRSVWPDAVVVAVGDAAAIDAVSDVADLSFATAEVAANRDEAAGRIAAYVGARPEPVGALPAPPASTSRLGGRLVVVLGAARSGTTWLHRMLSAHPQLAGTETGETWLFPDIAPLWTTKIRQSAGETVVVGALREFCDELLVGLLSEARGATHVCEKTPATVWRLPMMARVFPDAYYVHVVRDGRDAVLSMAHSGFADGDLTAAARTWVDAVNRVRQGSSALPNFREVRYEQLFDDPRELVGQLWDWIGLTPSAEASNLLEHRIGERVTPLMPVGDIGVGKWRAVLSPEQRREIEAVAAPLLSELGYLGAAE